MFVLFVMLSFLESLRFFFFRKISNFIVYLWAPTCVTQFWALIDSILTLLRLILTVLLTTSLISKSWAIFYCVLTFWLWVIANFVIIIIGSWILLKSSMLLFASTISESITLRFFIWTYILTKINFIWSALLKVFCWMILVQIFL
jgi:hypothetical protein